MSKANYILWHQRRKREIKSKVIAAAIYTTMAVVGIVPIVMRASETLNAMEVETIDKSIGADTWKIIQEVADEYFVSPELIESIIYVESSGRLDVVSSGGCVGLMQINEKSHADRMKRLGVTDLTDARQNILVGVDYLMELAEKYEDLPTVLMCYNEGEYGSAVKRANRGDISKYATRIIELSYQLEEYHYSKG